MSMSTIPSINIAPYLDGSDKESVAKQIGEACTSIGFFMISGHGINLELLSQIRSQAAEFFEQQPLAEKQKYTAPFQSMCCGGLCSPAPGQGRQVGASSILKVVSNG
eukprot:CAMPEP_0178953290 /NCGR_PEP_ID=MMETSP0789-20121207/8336_1 /TAXON_ID=3005 /ORGANISM="Rhizosolenia setigera, Strain CCMP 1694" /LENGTH=106 /DNA_ID=CAMNT_0020634531 /DNA_START=126 /DNA_END=446 /DNA_ORIENTATION=+